MAKPHNEHGFSILEVLLVLAIAAMIIVMGIRAFSNMSRDNELNKVKYNVDTIFQSMLGFYHANCYGTTTTSNQYSPGDTVTPGRLNPNYSGFQSPTVINLQTDLIDTGYLTESITKVSVVDQALNTSGVYLPQFNMQQTTRKASVCNEYNSDGSCKDSTNNNATIISWRFQVAVKLNPAIAANQVLAQTYASFLGAACLANAGDLPAACQTPGMGAGNYMVFQRPPAFASPSTQTDFATFNAIGAQFTQMYTTYPGMYLIDNNGNTEEGEQYVFCGS